MSLTKRAAKDDLKAPSSEYFNKQVFAAESRLATGTGTLNTPFAVHSNPPASAFASSPASTPVKTPSRDDQDDDEFSSGDDDSIFDMARSPPSDHDEDSPPAKRAKLDYESRESAEAIEDKMEDEAGEVAASDGSPIPSGPSVNRLTVIGAVTLGKLREDKTLLLAANDELVKDNVKLRKKLSDYDKVVAENDVLKIENKALESSLERENGENEELQVQLGKLRADKSQVQNTCDWYASQDAELRGQLQQLQQLQRAKQDLTQLQQNYDALVGAYNELHARAAPAPEPEPELDLMKGFERIG